MYLVDGLEPGVVFERLERGAVALPKELQPRSDQGPVGPVLVLIPTDRTEQDALWRLARLQVVDVQRNSLVRLLLSLLHLRISELNETVDDHFDRRHAGVLSDILVLHETLLGSPAFPQFYA